jgi:NADH-quinone oxidoreductase subunit G
MCDHGRLNYRWLNRRDRVDVPMVRQGATLAGCDWDRALAEATRLISGKRVFVLASPMLSNEALFLLAEIARPT